MESDMSTVGKWVLRPRGTLLAAAVVACCVGLAIIMFRAAQDEAAGATAHDAGVAPGGNDIAAQAPPPGSLVAVEAIDPEDAVPVSSEERAQRMRMRAMDLDQNFMEDPRTPFWAEQMESGIRQIIDQSGYVGEDEYGITASAVECRTHGCKISLGFGSDSLTDEATMLVRSEMSGDFNQMLTVPLRHADGSVEYLIYAVAPGHGNLLRKRHPDQVQVTADQIRGN